MSVTADPVTFGFEGRVTGGVDSVTPFVSVSNVHSHQHEPNLIPTVLESFTVIPRRFQ